MDSKPYLRIFSSSSSLSGSFPIRAPPTPDSDSDSDSNSEINGDKSRYTSSSTSSGYVSAGSANGSEFETASERPLVADSDPDEKYELSCPFVDDPDETELEFEPVVEKVMVGGDGVSDRAMPIAQLSWESDDNDVVGSEVEDVGFSGRVRVNGNGFVEKPSIAPRVKVEEGEEGDGFLGGEECELNGAEVEKSESDSVELSLDALEEEEKDKYMAGGAFVKCPNGKRDGVDLGVEEENDNLVANMNSTSCFEDCGLSEQTKDEDALCGDLLKSITLSSLSVTVLCEHVARSAGAVRFQDDGAYGAKAEVPLEEKDFSIEVNEGSDLSSFVKGQEGDSMESERTEDRVAAAEINEPSVELNINVVEDSIVQCPNGNRDGVDASGSFEGLEIELHSGTDFGIGGNENQIRDSSGCSQPNPVQEMVSLRTSEATEFDRYEYVVCDEFLHLIAPSSNLTRKHIRDETEVKNFKIHGSTSEVNLTLTGQNVITGLSIEDQMAIGNRLVLAGSVGALQFEGDTADGARLEMRLKNKNFPNRQDGTSLGLSLMKWGGALVLTTDILSQFSVGSSNISVNVVLDNNQRGKIAIRASSSDKLQSVFAGILSIAIPIFGIFSSRFSFRNSAQ